MFEPKVSIIIPVYNAESTIERCLGSLINNSYKNLEIILVDDCSTDNSLKICRQYESDSIIVYHSNENHGPSFSRNKGLELSTGDYIMFVDSDDWVEANYVKMFVKNLNDDSNFIICGYYNHDEMNSGVLGKIKPISNDLFELYNQTLLQQLWTKIFDARIVREINIRFNEELTIGEDFDFILHYLDQLDNLKIKTLDNMLYHYMRDQTTSLMYNVDSKNIDVSLYNLRHLYKLLGKSDEEIKELLEKEKNQLIDVNAYLIMHNKGMSLSEKKKLIKEMSEGNHLYRKNRNLYFKEKIVKILNNHKEKANGYK